MKEIQNDVRLSPPFRSDQLLPLIYLRTNFKIEDFSTLHLFYLFSQSSRWDRYLGMTAPMTQVPVPTAKLDPC